MKEKNLFECRKYDFDIRAKQDQSGYFIEGRPIVYEKKTDICGLFEETIAKGALDGADLSDVRFLVNHDLNKIPLARFRKDDPDSTMKITVDEKGMKIRVSLDVENNAEAGALYSAVKRRDITGMSFMFDIAEEAWEEEESDYPKRRIKRISTVLEVSAVTFPAYEDTDISVRNKKTLENAKRSAVHARTGKGTDELELIKLKNKILGGF